MDPAVLIFLLYVMIAHELFCGWMHYRRQRTKYRKAAGPVLRSRCVRAARVCVLILATYQNTSTRKVWIFVGK